MSPLGKGEDAPLKSVTLPCLVIVSAPSGAGKTTLCARLLEDFPSIKLSISSTTRPPRGQEVHKKHYFFLTRPEFEAKIAAGGFAEWALVHNHYYGTSKETIETCFANNQNVLLDIDVQGSASLRASYPTRNLSLFISPPDLPTLEARLRGRGTDSEETILRRMKNAATEMNQAHLFDQLIVTDVFDVAYQKLFSAVSKHIKAGSSG